MRAAMLVGVDFDNTIVCCDQLFHRAAVEQGLIPGEVGTSKGEIRDYLRACGREGKWTELQGHVYGGLIREAPAFPGVADFFCQCRGCGIGVCIISHKTRYPFLGRTYDLHQAAHDWLERQGFYDTARIGLSPGQVFFELTKREKLERIGKVGCSHFVDDLAEFLAEPGFPAGVERILFDPNNQHPHDGQSHRVTSWSEVERCLIGAPTPV